MIIKTPGDAINYLIRLSREEVADWSEKYGDVPPFYYGFDYLEGSVSLRFLGCVHVNGIEGSGAFLDVLRSDSIDPPKLRSFFDSLSTIARVEYPLLIQKRSTIH